MIEVLLLGLGAVGILIASRWRLGRAFLIVLLATEFFHLEVGTGYGRLYHPLAVLILVLCARALPRLLRSPVMAALLAFLFVNVVAVLLSDAPDRAATSLLGFLANLGLAISVAVLLTRGSLALSETRRLLVTVTLVSVVWSFVQIGAVRLLGINLGLSSQQSVQVAMGFGPGLRTEANTFGKFLLVPLLVILPEYLESRGSRWRWWLVVGILVAFLASFTRSAVFGLVLALGYVIFTYWRQGRLGATTRRGAGLLAPVGIGVSLLLGGYLGVSEYAQFKAANLFNRTELLEGGSSGYRLMMMQSVIDRALSDGKALLIGNGWGQTYVYHQGMDVQAGGGDLVNVLGYAGLVGVVCYLLVMLIAAREALRIASTPSGGETALIARGVLFALVGVFFTGLISGYLIAPEFWMLLGIVIYLGVWSREADRARRPRVS